MTSRNMERLRAEQRMRKRGTENVHESGYAHVRAADRASAKSAERVAQRIAAWKREPSFEELVEAERHNPGKDQLSRAQKDEWLSGILNACED